MPTPDLVKLPAIFIALLALVPDPQSTGPDEPVPVAVLIKLPLTLIIPTPEVEEVDSKLT